jgi:hypothetical protein
MARRIGLFAVAMVLFMGSMAVPGWRRLCHQPLDLSGAERSSPAFLELSLVVVPGVRDVVRGIIQEITRREELEPVTYAAHAGLGRLLGSAGCDSVATGLQWLKAGAHAHSPEQVEAIAKGIAEARAASGIVTDFDTALCGYVSHGFSTTEQVIGAEQGGVECGLDKAYAPD